MLLTMNTLTEAQAAAIEQLRCDELGWFDLTLDMPQTHGGHAWVEGTPTWGGEYSTRLWKVSPSGTVDLVTA